MMLTGLRRGKVASLTVRALQLDEANPYVCVEGKHAKSGRAATLPLRADLAEELRRNGHLTLGHRRQSRLPALSAYLAR